MANEVPENPYVKSLGKILSNAEFAERVSMFPEGFKGALPKGFDEKEHLMEKLSTSWFLPEERHYLLYRELHKTLKHGYEDRPDTKFREIIDNTVDWLENHKNRNWTPKEIFKRPIRTINLFAPPGTGKSHFWNVVLPQCFTQVVKQSNEKSNKLQVTYLVLNCSSFKSLKSVCTYFFVAMDSAFHSYYDSIGLKYGESLHDDYDKPHFTAEKLLPHMANVAARAHLGVLIIDEINHLTDGNKDFLPIINFFKNLTNSIGLPVIFSGTQDALDKLMMNMQMTRRIIAGLTEWEFYNKETEKKTADWNKFIEELWSFQVVDAPIPFSISMADTFFDKTAGVMDFCIQLHIKAQTQALLFGKSVNEKFLEKIWDKHFKRANEIVNAIKTKNRAKFPDIVQGMPTLAEKLLNKDVFSRLTSDLEFAKLSESQVKTLIAMIKSLHPDFSDEKATAVLVQTHQEVEDEKEKQANAGSPSAEKSTHRDTSQVLESGVSDDADTIKTELEKRGMSGLLSNTTKL